MPDPPTPTQPATWPAATDGFASMVSVAATPATAFVV
jgi:hypothetical protein